VAGSIVVDARCAVEGVAQESPVLNDPVILLIAVAGFLLLEVDDLLADNGEQHRCPHAEDEEDTFVVHGFGSVDFDRGNTVKWHAEFVGSAC